MIWRLMESGEATGAWNMALDEAIFSRVESGDSPPTLRVYAWQPACVSLGHHQQPERELEPEALARDQVDVVRRATGGRAVFHVAELTYSVAARYDSEPWCRDPAEAYRLISSALAGALDFTGFAASLEKGYPVERPRGGAAMSPCFTSTSRSEVVWGERKLIGSAQRKGREAFLQHGSILLSAQHRRIVDYLNLDTTGRTDYLRALDANAVSLEEALGRKVTWREASDGFLDRLGRQLGINALPSEPTESELELARKVEPTKRISI